MTVSLLSSTHPLVGSWSIGSVQLSLLYKFRLAFKLTAPVGSSLDCVIRFRGWDKDILVGVVISVVACKRTVMIPACGPT